MKREYAGSRGPDLTRRRFIKAGCAALAAMSAPVRAFAAAEKVLAPAKALAFYNTHTGESLDVCFWECGAYLSEAQRKVDFILRDHRNGEMMTIDRKLLDLLHSLRTAVGSAEPFHIISGYRSPATNRALRKKSRGVAKGSLHQAGKAADIRLPGCSLKVLKKNALALGGGGVGFYPRSDFIHVDTGRVRHWTG